MEPIYLVLDTETGGTDPQKSALLQVACEVVGTCPNVTRVLPCDRKFDAYIFPGEGEYALEVHPKAVEVNKLTPEALKKYGARPEAYVFGLLQSWFSSYVHQYSKTDKFHLVGYNVKFDEEFLRAMWTRQKDKYFGSWFWSGSIDVMALAALYLAPRRHLMKDFKLTTVAPMILGEKTVADIITKLGDVHNAVVDVALTKELFIKLGTSFGHPPVPANVEKK
jgi:DNA polymerase III subunit epsilon